MSQQRLSVSIDRELAVWVRQEAARIDVTVSAVVADALRFRKVDLLRREIIEGLTEQAARHQALAREGMAAAPRLL